MSRRLVIDSRNELKEWNIPDTPPQPKGIKAVAILLSYIFHPVFVPIYIMYFIIYVHPYIFAGISSRDKVLTLAQTALLYTFFPLITVLLLKGLGFISSLKLQTQRERIIPLLATMTWSFWIWHVWRNLPGSPHEIVVFSLSAFIAVIIAWLMNIYFKVSLHAISMGTALAFLFWLAFTGSVGLGIYLSLTLLIAGLVCSARLAVSDHLPREIYSGLAGGILALILAVFLA